MGSVKGNISTIIALIMALIGSMPIQASNLEQWEPWVLETHKTIQCPWVMSKGKQRACVWPGKLTLEVNDSGAAFTLNVDVYEKEAVLRLPGSQKHWPTAITDNGQAARVIERNGIPHMVVAQGTHKIAGQIRWAKRPGKLAIPDSVAIVELTLDDKAKTVHRRNGAVIFSGTQITQQKKATDSLSIEVYRLLNDGIPVLLTTEINLSVSGKPREIVFGSVMLAGTEVLAIDSPVPARMDPDGTMRAQVSPGQHALKVHSRFLQSPTSIQTNKITAEWPKYEYISFRSNTALRQVKLSGPISIDTTQINIPGQWRDYPTYRMDEAQTLVIDTEYRGDHSPAANELHVKRDIWLDFDGKGMTSLDQIVGEMNKDWRLNAAQGTRIGRASVDDAQVLITQDKGMDGIEVRSPAIELEAVTRIDATSGFAASGWDARADEFDATLHLPPGWRVLHATGVDRVWGTWLSRWDLWDVFLMLIIISATRKLINNGAAIVGGCAFLIALHEPGTPLLIVPALLIAIALLPIASGRVKATIRSTGVLGGVVLGLMLIGFAVTNFRLAIYPSLERAEIGTYHQSRFDYPQSVAAQDAMAAPELAEREMTSRSKVSQYSMALEEVVVTARKQEENLYQVTENDRVQTGPGMPTWTWQSVGFASSGPVAATQKLQVYYSSPLMTSLWRVAAVLLVGLYSLQVLIKLARLSKFNSRASGSGSIGSGSPGSSPSDSSSMSSHAKASTGAGVSAGLVVLAMTTMTGVIVAPEAAAQDYPPEYLLKELENRLTKAPECLPHCASLNDGSVTVSGQQLTIRFSAYVDADVALPLPKSHGSWSLISIKQAGETLPTRLQRQGLQARLSKGHHTLTLTGRMTGEQATIHFPLPIHNLQVSAPGWVSEGLVDGRLRNNTLTLRSEDIRSSEDVDTLKAATAPVFVKINRRLVFGKKWMLETSVERMAPQEGAISVPVQLLANEKLLQDMGEVSEGMITVQLGHRQHSTRWRSTIEPVSDLEFTATQSGHAVEQWTFTPSSLWRLEYAGLPPVKPDVHANAFEPVFRPWPGETLKVSVRKPEGVAGETHTVENAVLSVKAGDKLQRSTLTMEIRSSLGEDYTITLPAEAEVLKFSIDGRAMNTPAGNLVKVPLQPGSQAVMIEFQTLVAMGIVSSSPKVILPDGATNVRIEYRLPRDRWPLYVSGPAIGPAMLYWGVLCVIIIGAVCLPSLAKALGVDIPVSVLGWLLLGVGLSTVNSYGILVIASMFFILAARDKWADPEAMPRWKFNGMQCLILLWVAIAVLCMVSAIPLGLLSNPEMKVVGNGSSSHFYRYYQDIVGQEGLPSVDVVSVPMMAYRAVMLLWSLWLSTRIITWAVWAWRCFSQHGAWLPVREKPSKND